MLAEGAEDVAPESPKIHVSITPLLFDGLSSRNPREYLHKPYIARISSHWATSSSLIVWVCLHSNFRGGSERRMCFETECIMALQGHPRLLTSAPIKSAYATSYWSSIVMLVLSFPFLRYCRFSAEKSDPTRILGVFSLN